MQATSESNFVHVMFECELFEQEQKEGRIVFCEETEETWKCVWVADGSGMTWQRFEPKKLKSAELDPDTDDLRMAKTALKPDVVEIVAEGGAKNLLASWESKGLRN